MLTLNDGRAELWQWDTGRTLAVDADCSQVHFSNKVFGRSIDVDVVNGAAIIPDVLLQTDKGLNAWAFVGTAENGYTKISKTFKVNRRNKPADYVFTPPDQTTLAELSGRLDRIEESQSPDAIKNAVDDYLKQNPVEAPVDSVNGKTGAVQLTAADVGAIAYETDPTVPGWAKQPQKPAYTANEIGAVSQDDLQAATNEALAQAKASGEFDGPQGPQGPAGKDGADGAPGKNGTSATHSWNGTVLTITSASGTSSSDLKGDKGDKGNTGPAGKDGAPGADGKTPEYGVDYGTPEQIADIAQKAAEILQPDVNQIKNDLANYKSLTSMFVTGADVEQEVVVKTINEDDVTWEDGKSIYARNTDAIPELNEPSHTTGEISTSRLLKLSDYIDIGNDVSKISITVPTYKAVTDYGTVYYNAGKSVIGGRIMTATGSYGIETVEIIPPVGTRYIRTCYFKNTNSYHTINFKIDVYTNQLVSVGYGTDTSLSMENKVADAKATGDAIMNLTNEMKKTTLFRNEITVNVSDWVSDSANASDSIEEMIKFSQAFEKRVLVFDMDVTISRAILLPSNTTVLLKNCTITQADETFDNVFRGENVILDDNDYVYVPEDISQLKNIKIIGKGIATINGPAVNKVINSKSAVGHEFGARTHQIDFTNVEGLEIRNITFNRTRGWCIELEFVSHFELSDLVFHTDGVKNGDGIDIRGGCKYGNVYNISGDTGDDTVAFNTHVSLRSSQFSSFPNSTCYYPLEFGYKYNIKKCTQDPTSADIHDVSLNNISKEGGSYHICIFLAMYGHRIYNISMSNLLVSGNVVVPSDYSWISCYNYGESTYNAGDISGIRVNNYINEATHTGYSGSVSMLYSNLELLDVWVNGLDNKNTGDVLTNLSHADGVKVTNSKTV